MSPKPRVIAFEGVDGAGKSTVIGRVAQWLRERGESVYLPRSGKEHDSRPTRMIRRLTRDPRNLELSPRAELQLYCARESQILDESVDPALVRGQTVLLDRSLLTPVVLGAWGRGLDRADCEAAARLAAAGREPDLTLVFDVHPRTSRIRKRLDKVRSHRSRDSGRKGLGGTGLKERVRAGYNVIAAERGYPVFHVERASPDEMAQRVIKVIEGGPVEEREADQRPTWRVDPRLSFEEALAQQAPAVALYMTRSLICGRELRARHVDDETALVAWGLDREDALRSRLLDAEPIYALSGWQRRPLDEDDLRERHASLYPVAVLRALKGVDGERADAIRRALTSVAPGAVVESVQGREDAWAEQLRDEQWSEADPYERAESLIGCSGEAAARRRERLLAKHPAQGLASLRGVAPEHADVLLRHWSERAPKAVVRALAGRSDDTAHDLRKALLETGREVVDTIRGLDDPRAWALRRELAERWPSTVLWSLAGTPPGPERTAIHDACVRAGSGDLHLLRRVRGLEEVPAWPEWARSRPGLEAGDG